MDYVALLKKIRDSHGDQLEELGPSGVFLLLLKAGAMQDQVQEQLVRKQIVNKAGNRQTVLVNPDKDADVIDLVRAPDADQHGFIGRQKERLKAKIAALPGGQHILKGGEVAMKIFHAIERPLMLAQRKSQELAVEAGKQRGLNEDQTKRLARVLMIADFAGGYATGGVGLALGGAMVGKATSFLPSVSVAYLAYSTARDPVATLRAAKEVMSKTFSKAPKQESMSNFPDTMAGFLADLTPEQADWFEALFAVALAEVEGDRDEAFKLAKQAYQNNPAPTENK